MSDRKMSMKLIGACALLLVVLYCAAYLITTQLRGAASVPHSEIAAVEGPRVLIVGNSIVSSNEMDKMATKLAVEVSPGWSDSIFVRIAPPGMRLADHVEQLSRWRSGIATALGPDARWDFVVLQAQSFMLSRQDDDPELIRSREAFRVLAARVKTKGAKPAVLMTWGYSAESLGETRYLAMSGSIRERSVQIADSFGGITVPAGLAYENIFSKNKVAYRLLYRDANHPSIAGTYLAAAVLVGTLTGKPTANATWHPEGLTKKQARQLRLVADQTVRQSKSAK